MKMTWNSDAYGVYNLNPEDGRFHLWIQPRPSYCDRGHWSVAHTGLISSASMMHKLDKQKRYPDSLAYYFMDLDTAIEEAEILVRRGYGQKAGDQQQEKVNLDSKLVSSWQIDEEDQFGFKVLRFLERNQAGKHFEVEARRLPSAFDSQLWVWKVSAVNISNVDAADQFPRYYTRLSTVVSEMEHLCRWRLHGQPLVTPKPIVRESKTFDLLNVKDQSSRLKLKV